MTSMPDPILAAVHDLVDQYHAGEVDREAFIDAMVGINWTWNTAALDALYEAVDHHQIDMGLADEVVERTSRMRRLARQYQAGEIDRATFIDAMLAFEWNSPRLQLPLWVRNAAPSEQTSWNLLQLEREPVPDSLDELNLLADLRIIDRHTAVEIYRQWYLNIIDRGVEDHVYWRWRLHIFDPRVEGGARRRWFRRSSKERSGRSH